MKHEAPKIDPRTAPDIFKQVVDLLRAQGRTRAADRKWKDFKPDTGASGALIKIFARFSELIIERLNRVPEKNLLAFLDLLGASLLPPRAARAPLTFSLAEGSATGAIVPAGTQVAAVAIEGEENPVIFETERDTVITPARLTSAFARAGDKYDDLGFILPDSVKDREQRIPVILSAISEFTEDYKHIERIIYIAQDRVFDHPGNRTELKMKVELSGEGDLEVVWETWDGARWNPVPGATGKITSKGTLRFDSLTVSRPATVGGIEKRWLRGRLENSPPPKTRLRGGLKKTAPPKTAPPTVKSISLNAAYERRGTADKALANGFPVDTSRGFYPFGETPRAGDAFYLGVDPAFAEPNSKMNVEILLAEHLKSAKDLKLTWEFWNGVNWRELGSTTEAGPGRQGASFGDTTKAFTSNLAGEKAGTVSFTFPEAPAPTQVNGVEGYWVRARIASGNYGPAASYEIQYDDKDRTRIVGYKTTPAAAPSIASLTIGYETRIANAPPELAVIYDNFAYEQINTAQTQSSSPDEKLPPAFYMGFELPSALGAFPNARVSLYICANGVRNPNAHPKLEWEYCTGEQWAELVVLDGTREFTEPGIVEFLAPSDFAPRSEFGLSRYWLRASLTIGSYDTLPHVSCLLLNTAMASHAARIKDEILGSSDGDRNQTFRTALEPVLEGQRLEVREPDLPAPAERAVIRKESGEGAVSITSDEAGRPAEVWVTWTQTPDFYGSGARDRHYTIDHLAGEIRFGDGLSGMIPPAGDGNIRMSSYRTGGGTAGNRPAGSITELKTTVPYVEKVTNYVAASGGAEAETHDSLLHRLPRAIRHGGRAVTFEDYEDLAMLASPETARAKCLQRALGQLELVVLPHSTDDQPAPSPQLKRRVLEFIDARKSPLADVAVVGPSYVVLTVTVVIAPVSLEIANDLRLSVNEKLTTFLHPLTGGFDGAGWNFGRRPHDSDLYYLIEAIPGVDHVISLDTNAAPQKTDAEFKEGSLLVSSGKHTVTCEFTRL